MDLTVLGSLKIGKNGYRKISVRDMQRNTFELEGQYLPIRKGKYRFDLIEIKGGYIVKDFELLKPSSPEEWDSLFREFAPTVLGGNQLYDLLNEDLWNVLIHYQEQDDMTKARANKRRYELDSMRFKFADLMADRFCHKLYRIKELRPLLADLWRKTRSVLMETTDYDALTLYELIPSISRKTALKIEGSSSNLAKYLENQLIQNVFEFEESGKYGINRDDLLSISSDPKIHPFLFGPILSWLMKTGILVQEENKVYSRRSFEERLFVKTRLTYLQKNLQYDNLDSLIDQSGINLTLDQRQAVKLAVTVPSCIINTGNDAERNAVISAIKTIMEKAGRSVKHLTTVQSSTRLPACLVSDTLKLDTNLNSRVENEGIDDFDTFIVEDADYLNLRTAAELCRCMKLDARVIFIGNSNHIRCGFVFKMLDKELPGIKLNTTNSANELFKVNESVISTGNHDIVTGQFFRHIQLKTKNIADFVPILYNALSRQYGEDISIYSPVNTGELGIENLNKIILNGRTDYAEGDRIIVLNHTDQSRNGQIGTLISSENGINLIRFHDRDDLFNDDDLAKCSYAYAVNTKDSNQTKAAIIICASEKMTRSDLLTVISETTDEIVILGTQKALNSAIDN